MCGEVVKKDSTVSVIEKLKKFPEGKRLLITFPLVPHEKRSVKEELKYLLSKGFQRIYYEGEIFDLNEKSEAESRKRKNFSHR